MQMNTTHEKFSNAEVMWRPGENSGRNIRKLMKSIEEKYSVIFDDYWDFHQWSVDHLSEFWAEIWYLSGVIYSKNYDKVIDLNIPFSESPKWFEGAKMNYAENILKLRDDRVALILAGEDVETSKITYAELYEKAKLYAAAFKSFGVRKGDIVMCYMSNRVEAILGMLAAVSLGALWTGALPRMGAKAVLNRVCQIHPKILITVDRFTFHKEETDMLPKIKIISEALPSLEKVIIVPTKKGSEGKDISKIRNSCFIDEFLALGRKHDESYKPMLFEQVSVSHPIFINFTSGTTGVPKALVHSSGMLLTIFRDYVIHMNTERGDVFLSVSPVGWATWCIFGTLLFCGLTVVLYDGDVFTLHPTSLWDAVDEFRISHLFISPTALEEIEKRRYLPTEKHDLSCMKFVMSAGSVVKLRSYDFVYKELKLNVLFGAPYGSTEIMGSCSVMDFTLPLHKGEIPIPALGMVVKILDESTGEPIEGQIGEIVICSPSPAMVLALFDDTDGSKYKEKYFFKYPEKFHVGDNGIINPATKGLIVLGRSDETLKQRGCRFGSSEIYNVVEQFPEIHDSICVSQYNKDRDERAVLFLKMKTGFHFNQDLVERIRKKISMELTPRHVPDVILETGEIPFNSNGKKMEIHVKKVVNNIPCDNDTVANPDSMRFYQNRPELQGFS